MQKIIIYGIGRRYYDDFFQTFLLGEIEKQYSIIAVSDKRKLKDEERKNLDWPFINREKINPSEVELVFITSEIYYEEIRNELINQNGLHSNQIISYDMLLKKIYDNYIHTDLFKNKRGVEIGGPTQFFSQNIYDVCLSCDRVNFSNTTEWCQYKSSDYVFENVKLGQVIIADATNLKCIPDRKYDFCISSNNLEHIANPIKAMKEFIRITKLDGLLLIIVPMKSKCFDHKREFTSFDHILNDYETDVKEADLTHLAEILEKHDYEMDIPCGGKENFYQRSQKNFENRCLHHHVFSVAVLRKIFDFLNIEILESGDLAYNYFILGKIK